MVELTFLKKLIANKTSESKECDICHYWYFLNRGFKLQPNVCNRYHDLLTMLMKWKSKTRVTSYEFRYMSYEFKSTSYDFKCTSYEFQSTSYEFKSTSLETKSTSCKIKSTSWEIKSTS